MPLQPFRLSRFSKFALPIVLLASCDDKTVESGDPYCPPVANAGVDISTTFGSTVALDGTLSGYPEGCRNDLELSWSWSFDAVPVDSAIDESALTDNNTTTASFTNFVPDLPGTDVLSLVVCDDIECSPADLVVVDVSSTDALPVASAGDDVLAQVGVRAELDGTASYDPEGAAIEYSWALSATPECSALSSDDLFNRSSASPTLICDCEGFFVASLIVSDGVNWSSPDYVSITCSSGNQIPVADAGEFESLPPCTDSVIELNGFGSYDPEGSAIEYLWSVVAVPAGSAATDANLSDPTLPNPEFTWDVVGDYTFQLSVFDGEFWSAPDIATITVQESTANRGPIANAGTAQSTDANADCTSQSYVWSCGDCAAQDFELDGSGSFDRDGDNLTYYWTESTGTVQIESPYSSNTIVYSPPVPGSYNTATSYTFSLQLDVADCEQSDSDTVTITVNCTGQQ